MKKPKWEWRQLLRWLKDNYTESIVTKEDIVQQYKISRNLAGRWLERMHGWGYLRYYDRHQRGKGGYVLTEFAKRFVFE